MQFVKTVGINPENACTLFFKRVHAFCKTGAPNFKKVGTVFSVVRKAIGCNDFHPAKGCLSVLLFLSCHLVAAEEIKIAFIADAHFHDVYAEFKDHSFQGLPHSVAGKNATIRTMQSQLMSTRLFNENYFALLATLDDLVKKDIKYVGLVGDFSDDGQPVHLRRLKEILDSYASKYAIRFFAVPGNHDPGRPQDSGGGKDFLASDGREQKIVSKDSKECESPKPSLNELPVICTDEIAALGYEGILGFMGSYGFMPQADYIYWSTPYSSYRYEDYSYATALKESELKLRSYQICTEGTGGTYKQEGYTNCLQVKDASYLVEPVEGLWLLAIDANVYVPKEEVDLSNPELAQNYDGSGGAGYNKMISHKTQVIEWMAEVAKEANQKGKTLVTFSHFPMVDFYDNTAGLLADVFGEGKLELKRMPTEETSRIMAHTGIKLHFAGHLHYNDTGMRRYENDDFLVNIQVPSLAAYVPGYKVLTIKGQDLFQIETVELSDVPRFNELFEQYALEYDFLEKNNPQKKWDKRIMESKDYREFTDWHLTELIRNRFLPQWPMPLQEIAKTLTGADLFTYSLLKEEIDVLDISLLKEAETAKQVNAEERIRWGKAQKEAEKRAKATNYSMESFAAWTGFDLVVDFYRLMHADGLALKYIPKERLEQYELINEQLKINQPKNAEQRKSSFYLIGLLSCMNGFIHSEPNVNILINASEKTLKKEELR